MDPTILAIKDLIVAVGGLSGLAAVAAAFLERRKKRAEAQVQEANYANQISDTAMKLVEPLKKEVGRLTERIERSEKLNSRYAQRIIYLMGGIDQLIRQIKGKGESPVWSPNDWIPNEDENAE